LSESGLDGALSHLIEVIRLDRPCHGDAARLTCVAIFTLLGPQHATTRTHRRAFDMALFWSRRPRLTHFQKPACRPDPRIGRRRLRTPLDATASSCSEDRPSSRQVT